ncbi:hypothetical protein A3C18_01750 [Candidatus Kaiserbacteria bacterium RIFCSPHIGHO2_02_FULL_54_11b]|uniref:DUF3298 domain-containing protein n=2 Tax=Candidatus Kaiseribacteriota TaxID=1752734 RepID=A0A1F6CRZ0_9BACT|nr:MAG: hypothetical protein A2704_00235 [Candidatus Kaiserbacteria bacterium RIFCSPHIGHO2_01_FULL_54_36b]OGG64975.1 MAG: hypothetical protein A3C18_01750 [Candidatus Kaiserbacteria bacterium RIFCSPHIGHO2_02_FULL_54_11b]
MNRFVGYVLALIALAGIAYAIYIFVPKAPAMPITTITEADPETGTEMQTEVVSSQTDTYRIEVRYPKFGIPAVDAKIKAVVDSAVAEFKTYPANPPDSSTPQNEMSGSFDSVYAGPDIVSVALSISEYTGGAHPNTVIIGVNVEKLTGKSLTLDDALLILGKSLEEVAESSLKELKVILGEDVLFPEGAAAKSENYSTFLIGKDRVTFIFNNYQVAPYAAGHQEVWFKRVK